MILSAPVLTLIAVFPPYLDVSSDIVKASAKQWSTLQDVSLSEDAYRDKKRFCTDLSAFFEDGLVEERTAEKAAKALEKKLGKNDEPGLVWRTHELRARLLMPANAKGAAEAYQLAVDAYPLAAYGEPRKQSYFHHLVEAATVARIEAYALEKAEAWLRAIAQSDERMGFFYGKALEEPYAEAKEAERFDEFSEEIRKAIADRSRKDAPKPTGDVRKAGGDERMLYQVLGADTPPARGGAERDLVLVMAGGSGQLADFQSWVAKLATPNLDRYVFAVLSAPTWSEEQAREFVWVTSDVQKKYRAEFSVEEYADAVVQELRADRKLKLGDAFLFGWSSGGPAAYKTVLRAKSPFSGAYILSSVFKPNQLDVKYAKGKRFFLEQGRDDNTTRFEFAEAALKRIGKRGGTAKLEAFDGGHGFAMPDPHASFARALQWLSDPKAK